MTIIEDYHGHGEQNGLPFARGISTWQRQARACVYGRCGFAVCTPGLIVSPVARSVLAYCARRVAIPLALRGKARRAPYTGGRHGAAHLRTEIVSGRRDAGKYGNNL